MDAKVATLSLLKLCSLWLFWISFYILLESDFQQSRYSISAKVFPFSHVFILWRILYNYELCFLCWWKLKDLIWLNVTKIHNFSYGKKDSTNYKRFLRFTHDIFISLWFWGYFYLVIFAYGSSLLCISIKEKVFGQRYPYLLLGCFEASRSIPLSSRQI